MIKTITKSKISGEISAPSSKSALQRLIAGAFLSEGTSKIGYQTLSDDSAAALNFVQDLGAKIDKAPTLLQITGGFNQSKTQLMIGEAGLGLRMFSPILALKDIEFTINGKGSLLKRPVDFIVNTLRDFGISVSSNMGKLPLKIQGSYKNTKVEIDGAFSSQLLTGLLMALPLRNTDTELHVKNLKSKPYIDLTINILSKYNIQIVHQNYEWFYIKGNQKYRSVEIQTEGDWSGAAFLVVAAAIAGELKINDIDINSTQGDKAILDVIKKVGAKVDYLNNGIRVEKNQLNAFAYDATDTPDLFPPLVALAVFCKGKSEIYGVNRLKHKESNRALTLKTEFEKLGAKIIIEDLN
ncbi:MAG: 3-phosphoshikimate 1-carboxyvinyltransferase [Bacteroidales bacterium]|nr:3-phosphoshikimate 1-carboxyvinyltransferase [Bacteroidales bacterium]